MEWVLLEAHSTLLDELLNTSKEKTELIAQRCQRLSALVKRTTIPQSAEITNLQKRVRTSRHQGKGEIWLSPRIYHLNKMS